MYQFWSARDSLEVLRGMQSDSVDSIVTDPPYGISFMNRKWDYDVPSVVLWKECLRVLKPGGHMLVACGTRIEIDDGYSDIAVSRLKRTEEELGLFGTIARRDEVLSQ